MMILCYITSAFLQCSCKDDSIYSGNSSYDVCSVVTRGITTGGLGWTCPPHFPEDVPEIDADPLSLDGRCGGRVGKA